MRKKIYRYVFLCLPVAGRNEKKKKKECANRFGLLPKLYYELVSLAWNCIVIGKLYCNLGSVVGLVLYCKRRF